MNLRLTETKLDNDECFALIIRRQSILFHQQKYVVVTVESAARAHEAGAERS